MCTCRMALRCVARSGLSLIGACLEVVYLTLSAIWTPALRVIRRRRRLFDRHGRSLFLCSTRSCAELIHKRVQALVVEGWAQPAGPGERGQAMKSAPGDFGEGLYVAVAS